MKRDMELVRQILLAVEAHPSAVQPCELHIPGFSEEQIAYHTQLLSEAGFLDGVKYDGPWGAEVVPVRLTWAGHEFLEAAREPMRWTQAKALGARLAGLLHGWDADMSPKAREELISRCVEALLEGKELGVAPFMACVASWLQDRS